MKQQALVVLGLGITALFGVASNGCTDSPTQPTSGQVSLSLRYSSNSLSALPRAAGGASTAAVDSIKISRARFVLSRMRFKSSGDSTNFRAEPFVLELALSGSFQQIDVADVPFRIYREIEFKVHRVDSSALVGFSSTTLQRFADFLAGERYSIIIEGTVYRPGETGQAFILRSRVDEEQKYAFVPELVVSEGNPVVNATMSVSSFGWFRDSQGALVDPAMSSNENLISDNLKASIRVYKDNDRNGERG